MFESTMSWMFSCSSLIFLFKITIAEWFSSLLTRAYASADVIPAQMFFSSTCASSASLFCSSTWITRTTLSASFVPLR